MLSVGTKAPNFTLQNQDAEEISLSELLGHWIVLYFYPKDDTPGCTIEAQEFSALFQEFKNLKTLVFGVSPDSPKSHCAFQKKCKFSVPLLCDPEHTMLTTYGVWQKKSMYGKEYMGVVRTTYLIDPKGIIRFVWEKVNHEGHAAAVLLKVKELEGKK